MKSHKMKTLVKYTLGALLLLQACYPGGAEYTDELDLVITNHEESYDFGAAQTYSINDDIPELGTDPTKYVDAATALLIINTIKSNMASRGYELVDADEDPDLIFPVAAIESTTIITGCSGGWWGYWGYWGYGGCYYPTYYSYTSGTIIMTLWDKDRLPMEGEALITPQWESGINGLIQGSQSTINTRIKNSIDQAFTQSPYIQSN